VLYYCVSILTSRSVIDVSPPAHDLFSCVHNGVPGCSSDPVWGSVALIRRSSRAVAAECVARMPGSHPAASCLITEPKTNLEILVRARESSYIFDRTAMCLAAVALRYHCICSTPSPLNSANVQVRTFSLTAAIVSKCQSQRQISINSLIVQLRNTTLAAHTPYVAKK
jgi:hypothetical protein